MVEDENLGQGSKFEIFRLRFEFWVRFSFGLRPEPNIVARISRRVMALCVKSFTKQAYRCRIDNKRSHLQTERPLSSCIPREEVFQTF